ncbi:uncharacterized protein TNCV_4745321 [Trichonephila clavipes]|nr:uncharacterized protein TNCV_4745321 [Trichonephila clavipes]
MSTEESAGTLVAQLPKPENIFLVVVVTNATCLTKSERGQRNSPLLEARIFIPVVSLNFEHLASDSTIFTRFHPNLEGENPGGGQGAPTSLPLPSTTREDLRLDGYLEYPHAAKAQYISEYPCLLWNSNPVHMALQSASLTTISVGRHIFL